MKHSTQSHKPHSRNTHISLVVLISVVGLIAIGIVAAAIGEMRQGTSNNASSRAVAAKFLPTSQADCEAQSGTWARFGSSTAELCDLTTTDAGTECSDSSECEGSCVTENIYTQPTCSARTVVRGCFIYVAKGQGSLLCVE